VEREAEPRFTSLLARPASEYGIDLVRVGPLLLTYAALLLRWNERINLSGARSLDVVAIDLIADAFPVMPLLPETGAWIDVGSGAGLPGVVIAICRPDLRGVLLEPSQKRRAFLSTVLRTLALDQIEVSGDRLIDHVRSDYDAAMSRAVFDLREWMSEGLKLVKPSGCVLGFASTETSGLVPEAEQLPYDVGTGPRSIVRMRK
jgi:16S rRNA (guanine527-N7)-methyltransferase